MLQKPTLSIDDVHLTFGDMKVLDGVSLSIAPGSITALIGPNGAGKSSLLNCISGFYPCTAGRILLQDQDITSARPHRIAGMGVARTFQNIELFSGLTVLDNLLLSLGRRGRYGILASLLYYGAAARTEAANRAVAEGVIDFMELHHVRHEIVGTLSYGLQKRVELARALAMQPHVILADEPMAGMNAAEKDDMIRFMTSINHEHSIAFVLVEHDLKVVMDLSDHIHVLNFGRLIASGTPDVITADAGVAEAYLGVQTPSAETGDA